MLTSIVFILLISVILRITAQATSDKLNLLVSRQTSDLGAECRSTCNTYDDLLHCPTGNCSCTDAGADALQSCLGCEIYVGLLSEYACQGAYGAYLMDCANMGLHLASWNCTPIDLGGGEESVGVKGSAASSTVVGGIHTADSSSSIPAAPSASSLPAGDNSNNGNGINVSNIGPTALPGTSPTGKDAGLVSPVEAGAGQPVEGDVASASANDGALQLSASELLVLIGVITVIILD